MQVKTAAIVLKVTKVNDHRRIVDLLSREEGRMSVACSVTPSGRGRLRPALLLPLTVMEVDVERRGQQSVGTLRDLSLLLPSPMAASEPMRLLTASFLADFLRFATREEQQNAPLFDYVERALRWFAHTEKPWANFHLVVMMQLTRFIGFYPNLDDWHPGAWFDLRNSSFTAICPSHPDHLKPEEATHIQRMMRMTLENMHFFKLNRQQRMRLAHIIEHYYRLHVPNFPTLEALQVLPQILD